VADQTRPSIEALAASEKTGLAARVGAALTAAGSLTVGTLLALHHPVQPAIAVAAFVLTCVVAWRWQGI